MVMNVKFHQRTDAKHEVVADSDYLGQDSECRHSAGDRSASRLAADSAGESRRGSPARLDIPLDGRKNDALVGYTPRATIVLETPCLEDEERGTYIYIYI